MTTSNGPKQSEERFDRLFQGATATESGDHDDSDTSHILSEEKKLDTWADDSDEDSDDVQDFNAGIVPKKATASHINNNKPPPPTSVLEVEPHYDTLFGHLDKSSSFPDDVVVG